MQRQRERLETAMNGKLGEIKLKDKTVCEVSGPQLVYAPDQTGQPSLQLGWQLTLWLEHDRLIGQDPIGVTVPLAGLLPPVEIVESAVPYLLEEARKIRHRANSPIPDATAMQDGAFDITGLGEKLRG